MKFICKGLINSSCLRTKKGLKLVMKNREMCVCVPRCKNKKR